MKANKKVRFEKLETTPDALFPTAKKGEWKDGEFLANLGKGLPVGYTNEGSLVYDLEVGKTALMKRTKRNGVEALGEFETSPIRLIVGDIITTTNSVYRVTELDQLEN